MTRTHRPSPAGTASLLLLLSSLMGTSALSAQGAAPPPPSWAFEGEIGASVFFGASDQTTVATRVAVDRRSPDFEVESEVFYLYGEASDGAGNTFVNKRAWALESNLDYRRFSRVNPYVFAGALSSLEKAIKVRYKGGAGAKLTALDSETSRLDFALAILGEKTVEENPGQGGSEILARWAGECNLRRSFAADRTVVEAKTVYSPVFDEADNYVVAAEGSIAFKLSEIISLKLSVVDNYDSRAKDRGARDNNDGRVLFSVLSSF